MKAGDENAMYELGEMYQSCMVSSISRSSSRTKALEYFEQVAEKEHIKAIRQLIQLYGGSSYGFEQNVEKSKYYRDKFIKHSHSFHQLSRILYYLLHSKFYTLANYWQDDERFINTFRVGDY